MFWGRQETSFLLLLYICMISFFFPHNGTSALSTFAQIMIDFYVVAKL